MTRLIFVACIAQCLTAQRAQSVCDILKNIAGLRNTQIVVRGQWITGLEQNYLADDRCPEDFVLDSRRWPPAINLRAANSEQRGKSMADVRRSLTDKLGPAWYVSPDVAERRKILVTVKGILRAVPESGAPTLHENLRTNGLGHLNTFALQLEVTSMEQPQIVKRDPKK